MMEFDEYIKKGVVKRQSPDLSRVRFLLKEAEKSYQFLKKVIADYGINDDNANSIVKISYDIIMEPIRAAMFKQGYNSSGQGAHEAEVAFLKTLGFAYIEVQFADKLRYFRNGITYYGKQLEKQYATEVVEFLEKVYLELTSNKD